LDQKYGCTVSVKSELLQSEVVQIYGHSRVIVDMKANVSKPLTCRDSVSAS